MDANIVYLNEGLSIDMLMYCWWGVDDVDMQNMIVDEDDDELDDLLNVFAYLYLQIVQVIQYLYDVDDELFNEMRIIIDDVVCLIE